MYSKEILKRCCFRSFGNWSLRDSTHPGMQRNDLHSVDRNNCVFFFFGASGFPREYILARGCWKRAVWREAGIIGIQDITWRSLHYPVWLPSCYLRCSPTNLQEHSAHWLSMPCSYMRIYQSHSPLKQWVSSLSICPALSLLSLPWNQQQVFPTHRKPPIHHCLPDEAIQNIELRSHSFTMVCPTISPLLLGSSCADRGTVRRIQELHEKRKCFDP